MGGGVVVMWDDCVHVCSCAFIYAFMCMYIHSYASCIQTMHCPFSPTVAACTQTNNHTPNTNTNNHTPNTNTNPPRPLFFGELLEPDEKDTMGVMCRQLLDAGRLAWLREQGWQVVCVGIASGGGYSLCTCVLGCSKWGCMSFANMWVSFASICVSCGWHIVKCRSLSMSA